MCVTAFQAEWTEADLKVAGRYDCRCLSKPEPCRGWKPGARLTRSWLVCSYRKYVSWLVIQVDAHLQGMSYANGLAQLTPVAGLWSTAIPALVYGMLGTCR